MGFLENYNKLSGFIKCGEFLDPLRTCWLLWKDLAPYMHRLHRIYFKFNCLEMVSQKMSGVRA